MKLLFAGYRSWALNALFILQKTHPHVQLTLAPAKDDLAQLASQERWDAIVLVGWSWLVPNDIVRSNYVIAMHPSDLPDYRGGSPIQHQIIDGVESTQATLFRVTEELDAGPILYKAPLSLKGHMSDIFEELTTATINVLNRFIASWPNVQEVPQASDAPARKRLKPIDGELTLDKLKSMTCKQLYDFIRCRESPYPNVTMRDETGTLHFELVRFENG